MNKMSRLLCGCIAVFFVSCAATGDWEEDSLFFSPQMGMQRLAAKRAEVDAIRRQTAHHRQQTARLEYNINQAATSRRTSEAEARQIQAELDQLEQQSESNQSALNRLDRTNAELAAQASRLQNDIAALQLRIARLRAQLALIISTR